MSGVAETLFDVLPARGSLTVRKGEHGLDLVFRWDERFHDQDLACHRAIPMKIARMWADGADGFLAESIRHMAEVLTGDSE